MSVEDLFFEIISRGADLRERNGKIEYGPPSAVDPELRRRIVANQPELIELIRWDDAEADRIGRDVRATLEELVPPGSEHAQRMNPWIAELLQGVQEKNMIAVRVAAHNVKNAARYYASGQSDEGGN
jgi:hypothetical protein